MSAAAPVEGSSALELRALAHSVTPSKRRTEGAPSQFPSSRRVTMATRKYTRTVQVIQKTSYLYGSQPTRCCTGKGRLGLFSRYHNQQNVLYFIALTISKLKYIKQ